jgi:hypothetical protein
VVDAAVHQGLASARARLGLAKNGLHTWDIGRMKAVDKFEYKTGTS